MSPTTLGRDETLCDICSTLDLESYFQHARDSRLDSSGRPGATPGAICLGSFEDVYAKSSRCTFCNLVVCAICNFRCWDLTMPQDVISRAQRKHEGPLKLWLYSYRFAIDIMKGREREAFRIGISRRTGVETHRVEGDHIGDIQLFCGDAIRLTGSSLFHGRIVSTDGLDVELPGYWLECCEKNHMSHCQPEPDSASEPRSARVVDVQNSCICPMPENARYFALSYCWPVGEAFKLLRTNFQELQQVGSLASRMKELPVTIQDAISFIRDLGESYLWIDSLCILQDDEDDKRVQLNQMDRIYEAATATLVCAPATQDPVKACAGLPCFRKGTRARRQMVSEAKGLGLLVPFDAIISVQLLSRWSSRAWTYQELLLSRRLIFFTDTQIYFQCSISIFCEDSCGEDIMKESYVCPGSNLWNPGSPFANQSTNTFIDSMYIASFNSPPARLVSNYAQHVDEYTLREMSLSSDILNAFVGIQNAMQFSMQSRFLHGIPLRYVDKCLLWISPSPHNRRGPASSSTTPSEFPSWSWAGWSGSVSMVAYLDITRVRSEASWYLIDGNSRIIHFQVDDCPGLEPFPQPNNKMVSTVSVSADAPPANSAVEKSHKEIISSILPEPLSLSCWSATARFRVDGTAVSLNGLSSHWNDTVQMKIFDGDGRWVGSIITERALSEELLQQKQSRTLELMLISRSFRTKLLSDRDAKIFDVDTFEERSWCLLNVMVIERQASDAVRRLTIGVIHEDAWTLAQPTLEFLKLE